MEKYLELVKSYGVGIIEAFKYGFYILIKHINNWLILGGAYVGLQVLATLFALIFTFGTVFSSVASESFINDPYSYSFLDPSMVGDSIGIFVLYVVLMIVGSFLVAAFDNYIFSKSYFAEWEIKTQKRNFGYFVAKTLKFAIGSFLLMLAFIIMFGIVMGLSFLILALVPILGGLMIFLAILAYICAAILLNFLFIAMRYEYVINDYGFGESFSYAYKIIKGNLLEVFGFTLGVNLLVMFACIPLMFLMFLVALIPFVGILIMPVVQITLSVVLYWGYQIKYMNLKYRSSMNIFPAGFLDEEESNTSYQENVTPVTPVNNGSENTTPLVQNITPVIPVIRNITPVIESDSTTEENNSEVENIIVEDTSNSNTGEILTVENNENEEIDEIYKKIEDIPEIKDEF